MVPNPAPAPTITENITMTRVSDDQKRPMIAMVRLLKRGLIFLLVGKIVIFTNLFLLDYQIYIVDTGTFCKSCRPS